MATKTKKRPKARLRGKPRPKPKLKQTYIPGTEPVVIKEIETAAETYVELHEESKAAKEQEADQGDKVLKLLKQHNLTSYRFNGCVVEIVPTGEKVKVKRVKSEPVTVEESA